MACYKNSPSDTSLCLQKLMTLNHVSVNQKGTMFANKYVVVCEGGEVLFNVKEDASALDVMLGGASRGFNINLYDAQEKEVIRLRRPYSFGTSKLEVRVLGEVVSIVRQVPTFMKPVLSINDPRDQPVLRVKGPIAYNAECDFNLLALDKTPIGFIRKKWGGLMREMFTKEGHFQIEFPIDLDVRYKAAVIGTCLLIDFLYYEKN